MPWGFPSQAPCCPVRVPGTHSVGHLSAASPHPQAEVQPGPARPLGTLGTEKEGSPTPGAEACLFGAARRLLTACPLGNNAGQGFRMESSQSPSSC